MLDDQPGVIEVTSLAGYVQVGEQGFSLDVSHGRARDEWVRTYTLPATGTLEIEVTGGVLGDECGALLKRFFAARRARDVL